jgi:hypothetical protein
MPKIEKKTKPQGKPVAQATIKALKDLLKAKGKDDKKLKANTDIELAEELKEVLK